MIMPHLFHCLECFFASDAFDREFKTMVTELSPNEIARMRVVDRYPNAATSWCRKLFEELDLSWNFFIFNCIFKHSLVSATIVSISSTWFVLIVEYKCT